MVAGAQVAVGSVQRLGRRDWARTGAVSGEGVSCSAGCGGPWEGACALHRRGTRQLDSVQAQGQAGSWNRGLSKYIEYFYDNYLIRYAEMC